MATVKLYRHPQYDAMVSDWVKWRDMYEGKHSVMTEGDYLFRHEIELKPDDNAKKLLQRRIERTRYFNMVEVLVSILTSMFFKECPEPDEKVRALLGDAIDDVDNKGTSLVRFIKDYQARDYLIYGKSVILVDKTRVPEGQVKTLAEYRARGIRPSFEALCPIALKDWDYETENPARLGAFNCARYEYEYLRPRLAMTDKPELEKRCAAYRMENGVCIIDTYSTPYKKEQATAEDSQEWTPILAPVNTGLAQLPLVVAQDQSWIKDAAEEAIRYHNLRSTKDNIQFNQGYQRIFIAGVDFTNEAARRNMSEYIINGLPEGAVLHTVDPTPVDSYDAALAESMSLMFKLGLNQTRAISDASQQVQGADTIEAQKENTADLVESCVEDLENQMDQAVKVWAAWEGKPDFDGKVPFNHEISEVSIEQMTAIWNLFRDDLKQIPVVNKAVMLKAAGKLGLEEDAMEAVRDAVEKMPETKPLAGFDLEKAMNG